MSENVKERTMNTLEQVVLVATNEELMWLLGIGEALAHVQIRLHMQ